MAENTNSNQGQAGENTNPAGTTQEKKAGFFRRVGAKVKKAYTTKVSLEDVVKGTLKVAAGAAIVGAVFGYAYNKGRADGMALETSDTPELPEFVPEEEPQASFDEPEVMEASMSE